MRTEEFVGRLDKVKRTARGYMAQCPAHPDKNPSLSVQEGDEGILVHCWSGCAAKEIMAALGLEMKDLFYDADVPPTQRRAIKRPPRVNRNRIAFEFRFRADLLTIRATDVLESARDLSIEGWTDEQLNRALNAVAGAHEDLALAAVFDDVAFNLRSRLLEKERAHVLVA